MISFFGCLFLENNNIDIESLLYNRTWTLLSCLIFIIHLERDSNL